MDMYDMPFTSAFNTEYKHVHTTNIYAYTYAYMHIIMPKHGSFHLKCATAIWTTISNQHEISTLVHRHMCRLCAKFCLSIPSILELWLIECGHHSRFSASKLALLQFLPLSTGNNFISSAHRTMKFAGFTECVMYLWQMD